MSELIPSSNLREKNLFYQGYWQHINFLSIRKVLLSELRSTFPQTLFLSNLKQRFRRRRLSACTCVEFSIVNLWHPIIIMLLFYWLQVHVSLLVFLSFLMIWIGVGGIWKFLIWPVMWIILRINCTNWNWWLFAPFHYSK